MTIDEILAGATASYRECGSYSDTGRVHRVLYGPIPTFIEVTFRTAFVRGAGICFEARERVRFSSASAHVSMSTHVAVWGEERRLHSWSSKNGRGSRWRMAAEDAPGGLHGRPGRILSWLCPRGTCASLVSVGEHPIHIADEPVDGRPCLQTLSVDGPNRTLAWIDRETLLLRGLREESTTPSGLRIETDCRWVPLLDPELHASALDFVPPM